VKRWDDATAHYDTALRECRAVLAGLPTMIAARRELAHIFLGLGETALAQNRVEEGRAALVESREQFNALAAENRLDAADQRFRDRLIQQLERIPATGISK
jgi:hypothetical protein